MLRFPEELMLLILDDENGRFARVPDQSLRYALSGGVLMDLAMENRIDTDPKQLVLLDSTPVNDGLLDPTLADISQADETHDARYWVERTAIRSATGIREASLDRLVEKGILERRDDRFLWVFRSRRYPVVDDQAEREVKLRIMEILFSDQIPGPSRRRDHQPCARLQPLQPDPVRQGTGARGPPNQPGAQTRSDRPGDVPGNHGNRTLACPRGSDAAVLACGRPTTAALFAAFTTRPPPERSRCPDRGTSGGVPTRRNDATA